MRIETKFNIGDEVVFIGDARITTGNITSIQVVVYKNKTNIQYSVCGKPMLEDILFRNKEELFDAIEQQLANANIQETL